MTLYSSKKQRGVALITVLLITALATIIAVSMATRQQFDTQRTINIMEGDQANLLALGIEMWAQELLEQDLRDSTNDHLEEDWALELSPIDVEGGEVAGKIEDLQARFNLNNLAFLPPPAAPFNQTPPPQNGRGNNAAPNAGNPAPPQDPIKQYSRLLIQLGVEEDVPSLTMALVDWVDKDSNALFPGGGEDNAYLEQKIPYRAANRLLRSVNELLWVKGYNQTIIDLITPYVTALPKATAINVNTASAEVLMSLAEGITDSIASDIIDNRGDKGYASKENFLQQSFLSGITIPVASVSIDSQYFLSHGFAHFGNINRQVHSVIAREKNKSSRIILRQQGRL